MTKRTIFNFVKAFLSRVKISNSSAIMNPRTSCRIGFSLGLMYLTNSGQLQGDAHQVQAEHPRSSRWRRTVPECCRRCRVHSPLPVRCGPCCRPARRPRRAPAGSGRRTPTHRRGSGRWDAGTARTAAPRADPWRRPDRPARRHALKGQVPGGEPGILPLVGHGHDAQRVEVPPVLVADRRRDGRRRAGGVVAVEPDVHVEEIALLGPEQAGQRLALDAALVLGRLRRDGWRRRTRRPRRRRSTIVASTSSSGSSRSPVVGQPQAQRRPSRPAGTSESDNGERPWCRPASG